MGHQIDTARLEQVLAMGLKAGGHDDISRGLCVMEAVSYVAGESWSDSPQCACPVISAFLRNWNDSLPDDERNELLRDLIPRLVGTRSTPEIEQRRATMAADWLIREHAPAWLRVAGMNLHADALSGLPEITDFSQCPNLMPALEAARRDASAAWADAWDDAWATAGDASWAAAGAAARAVARDAAWATAGDAARATAGDASWATAWAAAWATERAAAWATARDAAWDAARATAVVAAGATERAAAGDALANTRRELQQSAKALVIRMIECSGGAS